MTGPRNPRPDDEPRMREVLTILDGITDPCSTAAGVPAGLVSMGLVRLVELPSAATDNKLRVTLTITEPGCLMAAIFAENARDRLARLEGAAGFEGLAGIDVVVDTTQVWEPHDMTPEYRKRLADARSRALPLAPP